MVDVTEVARNIYLIDEKLYSVPGWGCVYLINEEKKALVDSGPTSSAGAVLDGIKQVGVSPEDIDYLIVTHVHLDHAGGAGVLIKQMPRAQVVVHHRGARHLVNPERLVKSVIEGLGNEAMERFGEVAPIEAQRVKPVNDGDVLRLSEKQALRFIDAPGHAPHELCVHESLNNGLFVGDAVGIYLAEKGILLPVTPPPQFDAEVYVNTLERLIKLEAARLYFPHFGIGSNKTLQMAIDKLRVWHDIVARAAKDGQFSDAAEKLAAQRYIELEPIKRNESLYKYVEEVSVNLSVKGYIEYCRARLARTEAE